MRDGQTDGLTLCIASNAASLAVITNMTSARLFIESDKLAQAVDEYKASK